ncbi:MAG: hypothetical protein KGJ74_07550 [Betaproteobacteria bacterium]|nr:hypothetical protein [Betaproteobacteria bacterium]
MQNENSINVLAAILDNIDQIDNAHITMKCPAHNGAFKSSLEVTFVAGRLHMQCMCGCTQDRILAAVLGAGQEQPDDGIDAFIDALAA